MEMVRTLQQSDRDHLIQEVTRLMALKKITKVQIRRQQQELRDLAKEIKKGMTELEAWLYEGA